MLIPSLGPGNLLEFLIHRFGPLWMSKLQCPVRETPMASLLEVVSCQPHREPLYTSLFSCLAIYQEQSNSGPKEDNISQIDVLNSFIQYLLRACYVLVWILVVKKVIQVKKTMIKGEELGALRGLWQDSTPGLSCRQGFSEEGIFGLSLGELVEVVQVKKGHFRQRNSRAFQAEKSAEVLKQ